MAAATIKGTSLLLTLDLVRERHGDEGVARLAGKLPKKVRRELPADLHVLPSAPYSFEAWAELLLAAEELFGARSSIARASSRLGYGKLLRTTYANWVREGDPLESIRRMPRLWEQVTKGLGDYEIVESDAPGRITVRVALHVSPRYRAITEERVAGTLEAMIEASAARGTVTLVRHASSTDCEIALDAAR